MCCATKSRKQNQKQNRSCNSRRNNLGFHISLQFDFQILFLFPSFCAVLSSCWEVFGNEHMLLQFKIMSVPLFVIFNQHYRDASLIFVTIQFFGRSELLSFFSLAMLLFGVMRYAQRDLPALYKWKNGNAFASKLILTAMTILVIRYGSSERQKLLNYNTKTAVQPIRFSLTLSIFWIIFFLSICLFHSRHRCASCTKHIHIAWTMCHREICIENTLHHCHTFVVEPFKSNMLLSKRRERRKQAHFKNYAKCGCRFTMKNLARVLTFIRYGIH